jgi:hypothetical protein
MKKELAGILSDLTEAVSPLLNPNFLTNLELHPDDQADFWNVKVKYTYPILAMYLSARYFASRYLGAEVLLPCYEVTDMLASPAAQPLAESIVANGDMKNLVRQIGFISRQALELQARKAVDDRVEEMQSGRVRKEVDKDTLNLDENFEKGKASLADLFSYRRPKGGMPATREKERSKERSWEGEDVEMWDITKVV